MNIAKEFQSKNREGKYTFVGMLRKYLRFTNELGENTGLSRYWNKKTFAAYLSDYDARLIPTLYTIVMPDKALQDYSGEDFEDCLNALAQKYHYAENTLLHYRYLLWIVYQAGFQHGHYSDQIFWSELEKQNSSDTSAREAWRINAMTRLRKSFSPKEELKILDWLLQLDPCLASGEDVGLVLMYFLGLRNNEACGANFSAIYASDSHPEVKLFDMVMTTKIGSTQLKAGGKTSNAPRLLPIPEWVYQFLSKRRSALDSAVQNGTLILPDGINTVAQLPIVCSGTQYTKRSSTKALSARGRALFDKLGINKSELALLFQILCSNEFAETQIEEKEPSTYLLRRNCATHLYQLNFSETELQYWMGHNIEDSNVERAFYSDHEAMLQLKQKYDRHPLLQFLTEQASQATIVSNRHKNIEDSAFLVEPSALMESFLIQLIGNEPDQPIIVNISSSMNFDVDTHYFSYPAEQPRTAVIARHIQNTYRTLISKSHQKTSRNR